MALGDIRAGGAYVELLLQDKDFKRKLQLGKKSLRSFIGYAAGIAASLGTALSFAGAIKAASDLEEAMSKFKVVFGDQAKEVKKWGDKFADEVGRSRKQVVEFLAESQDLFIPLGFEPGAATEMSKTMTKLAVDLASFNNKADADVMRDLHAALTGSVETMRKYGVVINETQIKQEALNNKLDPKKLSNYEKVQMRLNIIMRGTTAAQGDAIRTQDEFANQLRKLQATVANTAATFGTALLPLATAFVSATTGVLESLKHMAERSGVLFAFMGETVWEVMSGIAEIVSTAWTAVAGNTASVGDYLQNTLLNALSAISFGFKEWEDIAAMAVKSSELQITRFANVAVWVFSDAGPEYLRRFGMAFVEMGKLLWTVLKNMTANVMAFIGALANMATTGNFEVNWTPLTEGYKSALAGLEPIAAREIPGIEKELEKELQDMANGVMEKFDVHTKEFEAKKAKLSGKIGELEEVPGIDFNGLGDQAQQAKKRVFATFSASAAIAQGQGGGAEDKVVKAIVDGNTKQDEWGRKQVDAMNKAFAMGE